MRPRKTAHPTNSRTRTPSQGVTFFAVISLGSITLEREVVDQDRELLSAVIDAVSGLS